MIMLMTMMFLMIMLMIAIMIMLMMMKMKGCVFFGLWDDAENYVSCFVRSIQLSVCSSWLRFGQATVLAQKAWATGGSTRQTRMVKDTWVSLKTLQTLHSHSAQHEICTLTVPGMWTWELHIASFLSKRPRPLGACQCWSPPTQNTRSIYKLATVQCFKELHRNLIPSNVLKNYIRRNLVNCLCLDIFSCKNFKWASAWHHHL